MGQTAREHAEQFVKQAASNAERAVDEGDFSDADATNLRFRYRLDALEYLVARLAGDVDRLEAEKASGSHGH